MIKHAPGKPLETLDRNLAILRTKRDAGEDVVAELRLAAKKASQKEWREWYTLLADQLEKERT